MNRSLASAMSVAPLVLVTIAAAVVLTSSPPSAPGTAAPIGTPMTAAQTEAAAPPFLPETRGAEVAPETPHVLVLDGLRVIVPRLGIDLPLEVGDPERDVPRAGFAGATPEQVALVYPGSRTPGEGSGNTYIYAHARGGMFLSLWNAKLGDSVVISRADGSVVRGYQVALIVPRVDPADTQWLDAQGVERLTLQTSTGPRPGDPRFIVVAYPIAGSPEKPGLP